MRLFVLFFLVLTVSATDGQDNASKKKAVAEDLKKLEGKWAQVAVESDGKRTSDEDAPKVTLTITGNKWIEKSVAVADDGGFLFKIDPEKKPKQIDLTDTVDDQGKTETFPGIYALEGDTLTLAVPFPFEGNVANLGKRPSGFRTKPGDDFVVIVYKRVK